MARVFVRNLWFFSLGSHMHSRSQYRSVSESLFPTSGDRIYARLISGMGHFVYCPVGWGCRIHRLLLCNVCPEYDTKQSDGEVPVLLELWGMCNTPLIAIALRSTLAGLEAPDKDRVYRSNRTKLWSLELNISAFKLSIHAKLNCLK